MEGPGPFSYLRNKMNLFLFSSVRDGSREHYPPFYWETLASRGISDLPKVTQLPSDGARG